MKKINLILVLAIPVFNLVKGQNSCLNAVRIIQSATTPIPPVGTISPAGPDLGCLTVTQRQIWYYLPVCKNSTALHFNIGSLSGSSNDSIGAIVYGPFSEKVTNCSDLNASKILACVQHEAGGPGFGCSYNDTAYAKNYYYFLVTHSDGITSANSLAFFDLPAIEWNCFECNDQVSIIDQNNICIATVDTAINKCKLVWDEFPDQNLSGYKIMRESNLTGVYDSIDFVPLGSLSEYTDLTSSPVQKSYTYSVVGIDSCNNAYPPSKNLTTIHLLSFAGGNNQAQLIWNNIYSATDFIPQYYIYRNSNGTGWQVIDSIGITLPTMTYTDIYAPAGNNQYTVELRKITPCTPMRITSTFNESAFSNVANTNVTVVEDITNNLRIRIYPNPAKDNFTIDFSYLNSKQFDISIIAMNGTKSFERINSIEKEVTIERKNLPPGIYILEIKADKVYRNKLVLQ